MRELPDRVVDAMARLLAAGGARAASGWTSLPHGRVHHLEAGTGAPVVLLHGGTGGGANWFRQITPLAQHCRVLAPDLPGFGLSDPAHPPGPLGAAAAGILADWLERNALTDVLLVGTSFGGLAALRLAQHARTRLRALLLLDSAGLGRRIHPGVLLAATPRLGSALLRPSRHGTRAQLRWLLTRNAAGLDDTMFDALADFLYTTAVAAGTDYLAAATRAFATPTGQRERLSATELAALELPVSIVWGRHDRLLPLAHARRAARLMPDATLSVVDGVGHSPNWEAPTAVTREILRLHRRAPPHLA